MLLLCFFTKKKGEIEMEKLILMDGTELVIEEGASLDRIPVKVDV